MEIIKTTRSAFSRYVIYKDYKGDVRQFEAPVSTSEEDVIAMATRADLDEQNLLNSKSAKSVKVETVSIPSKVASAPKQVVSKQSAKVEKSVPPTKKDVQ